ncbi:hypothetical protein [Crossiella sp. CA198]|uniref:hypothetical protein n=1 Tax=Crossiella sp. CA198 TaxID=3455607 RepID=UPI003F8CFCDD
MHLDVSRWRAGARDPAAREAYNDDSRDWRRTINDAVLPPELREQLVADLTANGDVHAAADRQGLHSNAVYGRMRWDLEFEAAIEAALKTYCDQHNPKCGSASGYKYWRGRCRACRAAHRPGG